jgi:hypothetical protein
MRSILIALIAALCALPAIAAEQQQAPKDMVLLTVSGTIGESNRGALDPKKDSQLALQKADFKKAFAFDRAMLLGLEQGTVRATTAELGAPATFKGPLLREVLGRIEAAKMKITSSRSTATPAISRPRTSTARTGFLRLRPTACRSESASRALCGWSIRGQKA